MRGVYVECQVRVLGEKYLFLIKEYVLSRDHDGQRGQELHSRLSPKYSARGAWDRRGVGGAGAEGSFTGREGGSGAHLEECS